MLTSALVLLHNRIFKTIKIIILILILFSPTYLFSQIGWGNLQFPNTPQTISELGSLNAFGRVFKSGVTEASGKGAGITAELGFSTTNTNPNTWTNWLQAYYNLDAGNDDEYMGVLANLQPGTYYYTFRYTDNGGATYYYAGLGGGVWNGTTSTSGVLTVTSSITISPDILCEGGTSTVSAFGATSYEFYLNGNSQTLISSLNTFTTPVLSLGDEICVRGYPSDHPVIDGNINESFWGSALSTSNGGPVSGFGNNRLNAIHIRRRNDFVYIALAGRLDTTGDNKILLFFDTEDAGFNNLGTWTNRTGVFFSARNLNGGIQFDAGFNPDRILLIGVDGTGGNQNVRFFDFYNMLTNTNTFIGSNESLPSDFAYQANNDASDFSRGFELRIPINLFGANANHKVFVMLVNSPSEFEGTFISNQFLSPANSSEGNYGTGSVNFNSSTPNPINYSILQNPFAIRCIEVTPKPNTTPISIDNP